MLLAILIIAVLIFIYFVDKKERKYDKEKQQKKPMLKLYDPDHESDVSINESQEHNLKLFS